MTRPAQYRSVKTFSRYIIMRDGVRIALDITLPGDAGDTALPTILRQTRYHRRMKFRGLAATPVIRKLFDQQMHARQYFVERGYAWVDVCARGSGASDGVRPHPWSPDEVEDGREILDWIARQTWSNGRIGARGISYDGTAAEFLLTHQHPALRAVAPRFSCFDVYEDVAMPGGIHLQQFTRNWSRFNAALDRNRFDEVLALILELSEEGRAQLGRSPYSSRFDGMIAAAMRAKSPAAFAIGSLVQGVAPVDDDPLGELVAEHVGRRTKNLDVHVAATGMVYRGEKNLSVAEPELTIDDFSPHTHVEKMRGSAAIFNYTGWFDGAYQRAAIKRFLAHDDPGHRIIIGPWEHGGRQDISPWTTQRDNTFDHEAELLGFFDAHLLEEPTPSSAPRVRYYTIGAERWQTAQTWPPPGATVRRWHLGEGAELTGEPAESEGTVLVSVQGKHGTGKASRWRSLLPILSLIHYEGRSGPDVATFTSAPLPQRLEVTGHPLIHVRLRSTLPDARLFAYLEDVDLLGVAHYVTEGQLRAIHRRLKRTKPASHGPMPYRTFRRDDHRDAPAGELLDLEFDLLPTSYEFREGHSLRVTLAGADIDHFEVGMLGEHEIHLRESWIELPTYSVPGPQDRDLPGRNRVRI